ncbi:hypothetical protein Pyn_09888 [Prunus yedoensis var. nudiflora]|uniref:Uncharacterized protein n=1 Tax=Prunus yedoensis var. nudiflora TaxID=2094558 RepID=A0A314XVT6_PRUYE|nr:hypothetical protein Pyn_09888 [Prunus yedoensis var. nudiflora]
MPVVKASSQLAVTVTPLPPAVHLAGLLQRNMDHKRCLSVNSSAADARVLGTTSPLAKSYCRVLDVVCIRRQRQGHHNLY